MSIANLSVEGRSKVVVGWKRFHPTPDLLERETGLIGKLYEQNTER